MITTTKPEFVGAPDAAHARATRTMTGIPSLSVSKGGRLWTTQIEEKRKSFQASRSASLLLPRRTPFVPLLHISGDGYDGRLRCRYFNGLQPILFRSNRLK